MSAARKSPEWLQQHRATIGGSNSSAAVGLNPYKTPLRLYHEMVLGEVEDLESNPDVLRGILLEPVARQRLSDLLDMEVIEHDQNEFVRSTKYHWGHALPDGWIHFKGERIPIEIKVPDPWNFKNLHAEVPAYIECQAIHNAAVLAFPALFLCCLNPVTMGIYTRLYEPTDKDTSTLMEAEERYWNEHIVPRVPPPPQQTREDFKLAWPTHVPGTSVIASGEVERAWEFLAYSQNEAKKWKSRAEEQARVVKNFMADNECLTSDDRYPGKVLATWRGQQSNVLDTKRLAEELPDVVKEYRTMRQSRVFLVKDMVLHGRAWIRGRFGSAAKLA